MPLVKKQIPLMDQIGFGLSFDYSYRSDIRFAVFLPPFLLMALAIIGILFSPDHFFSISNTINQWILDRFSWLFSVTSFIVVLTCVFILLTPFSNKKLGPEGTQPLLRPWQWVSVTVCTTTATGMLFWATAEPLFHLYQPPASLNIAPGSPEAATFALSTMYLHWSFTPFAIYTVSALAFALACHNLGERFSISSALIPLLGTRKARHFGGFFDSAAIFSLMAGMSASLGTGALVLTGGVNQLFDSGSGSTVLALVIGFIVITFIASSVSGLQKGIARLSSLNTTVFIIVAIITVIFCASTDLLNGAVNAFSIYIKEFIPRSLTTNLNSDDPWALNWSVFYWANWFSWAPVVGLFLGKIGRGYSVRAFMVVNFIIPSLFSIVWMTVFSGTILQMDLANGGAFFQTLLDKGEGAVIYQLLSGLPGESLLIPVFLFVAFLSYVTASDSNTDAIASLCVQPCRSELDSTKIKRSIKILWGLLIAFIAWFMTAHSSIEGIKMLSNLGGLPGLIITCFMNTALLCWVINDWKNRRSSKLHGQATNKEVIVACTK